LPRTNWQGYSGEITLSYLTQMLGLTVQNFVSAATGMAVLAALARGFARHSARTIGNFWADITRGTLYILLPLALLLALLLVSQGVVQTLSPGQRRWQLPADQRQQGGGAIAGPAASQVAISSCTNGTASYANRAP
jgi:K+-transporting ATPase ATPase A chain